MQKLMKSALVLIASLIFLGISRCEKYTPPEIERCIIGDAGCICYDPRLEDEDQNYVKSFEQCANYLATNPNDYGEMWEWAQDLKNRLEECESR